MTEVIYKVLDIRECQIISKATYFVPYGRTGQVDLQFQTVVTAVCLNLTDDTRKRFEFYPKSFKDSYSSVLSDSAVYLGYTGDYDLLVPGDLFTIKSTTKWPEVCIVTEEECYND